MTNRNACTRAARRFEPPALVLAERGGLGGQTWLLGALLCMVGCGGGEVAAEDGAGELGSVRGPSTPRPDVLVVAVDGLSLGDLGEFGDELGSTVGFDRLSRESAVYVNTMAPSPWANEALGAALSGRVAASLDGAPWTPSVADTLAHDGYSTALVLGIDQHVPDLLQRPAGSVVEASARNGDSGAPRAGEGLRTPGFQATLLADGARTVAGAPGAEVVRTAKEWLSSAEGPVFMVATLADPRPPHHLYPGFVSAAEVPYDGPMRAGLSHAELLRQSADFTEDDWLRLGELHASEVAACDQAFRQLAGAVIARRIETPPVLVLVGLRSPALGRGGRLGLVPVLDPGGLQVPMLIRFPRPLGGAPKGVEQRAARLRGDVGTPVGLVDLAPTLLDALGFEPRYDLDGRSVFPGARWTPRPLLALTQRGVRGALVWDGSMGMARGWDASVPERLFRRAEDGVGIEELKHSGGAGNLETVLKGALVRFKGTD